MFEGGTCVLICEEHQRFNNGDCDDVCERGQRFDEGECVTECGPGFVAIDGQCKLDCPPGTQLEEPDAYAIPLVHQTHDYKTVSASLRVMLFPVEQ